MLTEIKLVILASDILESRYLDTSDCAITRALHRAGYHDYEDCGDGIYTDDLNQIVSDENESYKDLVSLVLGMYSTKENKTYTTSFGFSTKIPIVDTEYTLKL